MHTVHQYVGCKIPFRRMDHDKTCFASPSEKNRRCKQIVGDDPLHTIQKSLQSQPLSWTLGSTGIICLAWRPDVSI